MTPWQLTTAEWLALASLVIPPSVETCGRGRPRTPVTRKLVEACLYRHYHSRSPGTTRSFGWNTLPRTFGVSPATANRRFNEWVADGTWGKVWAALLALRTPRSEPPADRGIGPDLPGETVSPLGSPVAPTVVWLERAYRHLNGTLFGGGLPPAVLITLEDRPICGRAAYFCARRWHSDSGGTVHHIMMSTGVWAAGAASILAALLHEAVHARCHQLGLPDTSARQYHNRHFRDTALVSGLSCGCRHPQFGYARTEPDDRGREAIGEFMAARTFPEAPGR